MTKNTFRAAVVAAVAMSLPPMALGAESKLLKAAENADALGGAMGSAIYTWVLVIGLILIAGGIISWVVMNKQQNQSHGSTKMVIISIVAGAMLSIISGVQMIGANLIDEDVDTKIDYRNLDQHDSNY